MRHSKIEVERKFRILHWEERALDILRKADCTLINQGYFNAKPATRVRLAESEGKKRATFEQKVKRQAVVDHKGQEPKIHNELEVILDEETGENIFELTKWKLSKMRFSWDDGDLHYDLDIFMGKLRGLEILEIEFPDEATEPRFPDGLTLREVTNDPRYSNKELSKLSGTHELSTYEEGDQAPLEFKNIDEGIENSISKIGERLHKGEDYPIVVGVAGPLLAGKTSPVTRHITELYGSEALVINVNDYFKGASFVKRSNPQGGAGGESFNYPYTIDLPLLSSHIEELKKGNTIDKPVYSLELKDSAGHENISFSGKVVVIEGLFALHPIINKQLDLRIFMDVGSHGPLWSRIICDAKGSDKKEGAIFKEVLEELYPTYFAHIAPQKDFADVVISEAILSGNRILLDSSKNVQVKSRNTSENNAKRALEELRFELDETLTQEDEYYYSTHWPARSMKETIRTRKEHTGDGSERIILTHNGPMPDNCPDSEASYGYELDNTPQKLFSALGYLSLGSIRRYREVYRHPEYQFVVNLDYFIHGDQVLPPIVEIEAATDDELYQAVRLLKQHSLHNSVFVGFTYAEMFLSK